MVISGKLQHNRCGDYSRAPSANPPRLTTRALRREQPIQRESFSGTCPRSADKVQPANARPMKFAHLASRPNTRFPTTFRSVVPISPTLPLDPSYRSDKARPQFRQALECASSLPAKASEATAGRCVSNTPFHLPPRLTLNSLFDSGTINASFVAGIMRDHPYRRSIRENAERAPRGKQHLLSIFNGSYRPEKCENAFSLRFSAA